MALPATDTFTAANGTALTTYSGSWSLSGGDFQINSNAVGPNKNNQECGAYWNADAFDAAQYATGTISSVGDSHDVGPAVRGAASGNYFGFYAAKFDASYLFKVVATVWTQLGSSGAEFALNDVVRLEADGTTITPKVNGVTLDPPGAQTSTSLPTGAAGLAGYHSGTTMLLDNWEGGNLAGGVVYIPRPTPMAPLFMA